jgi:superfamily II DNA helicase RecQ
MSVKLLFITPEKLSKSNRIMGTLERLNNTGRIARLIVDEAHCVSQWGRDFRSDYLKLNNFRRMFPNVPILALTATATTKVQ